MVRFQARVYRVAMTAGSRCSRRARRMILSSMSVTFWTAVTS